MRTVAVGLAVLAAALLALLGAPAVHAAKPVITPVSPVHNETIYNGTPLLLVGFSDADSDLDPSSVQLRVRGVDLSADEALRVDENGLRYALPDLFALRPGHNNITVSVSDASGGTTTLTYAVHFDPSGPRGTQTGPTLREIAMLVLAAAMLVLAAAVAFAAYIYKVKGLTYRKLLARYPIRREIFIIYVPATIGVLAAVGGLVFVTDWADAPRFAPEYAGIAGLFIAVGPYALDVKRQRRRRLLHERAFAQFLFELADAMRGGIDPVKATTELAKTETGPLKHALRRAADGIRLGRPFEEVMKNVGRGMKSALVSRYAALVGEASKVGGEISGVVYRAAKDMDELVKIENERGRQMKTPMFTMYVAFGVLLMMTATLMDFAPQLTKLDIAALGGGGLAAPAGEGGSPVARLSLEALEMKFFHLLLIMSVGTGLLIGSFTQGKLQDGLVHALFMIAVSAAFYPLVVL